MKLRKSFLLSVVSISVGILIPYSTQAASRARNLLPSLPSDLWQWPLTDYGPSKITQDYAEYNGKVDGKHHTGIDVYTDGTAAEIRAMADGFVALYIPNDIGCDAKAHKCADHGDGYTLVISHPDDRYSQYQHMEKLETSLLGDVTKCPEVGPDTDKWQNARHYYRCKDGQVKIVQGQTIGYVGGSGFGIPDAWPVHLHFEVKSFVLLNSHKDPYEWGYSTPHPRLIGYRDPVNYLEDHAEIRPAAHVQITGDGVGQPMTLGPNDPYPEALKASKSDKGYYARAVASATPGCKLGWMKLTKTEKYPPPDPRTDYFLRTKFADLPDVWMCIGNDIDHRWITGF